MAQPIDGVLNAPESSGQKCRIRTERNRTISDSRDLGHPQLDLHVLCTLSSKECYIVSGWNAFDCCIRSVSASLVILGPHVSISKIGIFLLHVFKNGLSQHYSVAVPRRLCLPISPIAMFFHAAGGIEGFLLDKISATFERSCQRQSG